ncbi:methylosome protein 50-like [Daphnia pulex]|uniref:methylosome protein 50-like n=1 Tax=Daphnia pulex TaxID=6669 RepID=UPI001EDFFB90|nr:methylosome protein 50-like [Daphnia pulex]
MQETPTDQIVDDATPVLHESGRTFDVIEIGSDGTSILGSSNMCTRYWAGILSVFHSPDDLTDKTKCQSSMEFEGGLSCAKFVSGSKVMVGLDSGCVSILNVRPDSGSGIGMLASVVEHDNVVSSLSISRDGTRALTGSLDRSLKVWHTDYLVCSHTYRPAHADMVVSVAIHPEQNDVMVSCSEDGRVVMWDLRMPKPALGISKEQFANRPSCVSFLNRRSTNLMIGTVSGHLLHLDASSPKSAPSFELGAHSRAVRKICPSGDDDDDQLLIATCADDRTTIVSSANPAHPKILYSDERHSDIVRGIAWPVRDGDRRRIFSCGWDRQVIAHNIITFS